MPLVMPVVAVRGPLSLAGPSIPQLYGSERSRGKGTQGTTLHAHGCAGMHTVSLTLAIFLMILHRKIDLGSEGVCDLLLVLLIDSPVRFTGWQTWQTYTCNTSHPPLLSGARSAVQPAAPPAELFRDAATTFQRARSIKLSQHTRSGAPDHATLTSVGWRAGCNKWRH